MTSYAAEANYSSMSLKTVGGRTLHLFVDEGLGHSSYVLELRGGGVIVVDPPRFPTPHERVADEAGGLLCATLDTHSHADYVSGSAALAERRGCPFVAPAASRLAMAHRGVADGDRVELDDDVYLEVVATPGHTPDHHAYVLVEGGRPTALFSGGSLMVGSVGRTDLCGPELAESLAHEMFSSLRRFDHLDDDVALYPTHGAGSFCAAPGGAARTSTLGHERRANPLFAERDEGRFVRDLLAGFGTFPTYLARLPELNRLGPTRIDGVPVLPPLTADELAAHQRAGGLVVDARSIVRFAEGHVPGSLSNALRPVFGSWLGWLVEPDRPIAFIVDDDQNLDDLVRQCLDVGLERLVGMLAGGIDAWSATDRTKSAIPLVSPGEVTGAVVDVRQAGEYRSAHVPGAVHVELAAVARAVQVAGPLTVMCGHGERAMTAASLLAAGGRTDLAVLDGGPDAWVAATGGRLEVGS